MTAPAKPSPDERAEVRFWARVERIPFAECWYWTGGVDQKGYGNYRVNDRTFKAHRYAYELLVGPIPPGLTIDHLCRERSCVRPDHLEPVTGKVNVLRGTGPTAINAKKERCLRGHLLQGRDVYVDRKGYRSCKACHREGNPKWNAAQRERIVLRNAVTEAALGWWRMKRPATWSEQQHVDEPAVNTVGHTERALALACAEIEKRRLALKPPTRRS